jgi:hypothetical protein
MAATTYSFADVVASIAGTGGTVQIGAGAAVAEEGISIEPQEDKDTLVWGADGELMHSLHMSQPFRVVVRLLKTSPTNNKLSVMFNEQQIGSATWGGNTISVRDNARGDAFTGTAMAFMRYPTVAYGKDGPMNEWSFGGKGKWLLGDGSPKIGVSETA